MLRADENQTGNRGTPQGQTGAALLLRAPAPPLPGHLPKAGVPAPLIAGAPKAKPPGADEGPKAAAREREAARNWHARETTSTETRGRRSAAKRTYSLERDLLTRKTRHVLLPIPVILSPRCQMTLWISTPSTAPTAAALIRMLVLPGHIHRLPSIPPFIPAATLTHRTSVLSFP